MPLVRESIRGLRAALDLTQKQFGERVSQEVNYLVGQGRIRKPGKSYTKSVSPTTVHNWERGVSQPGIEVVDAFCTLAARIDFRAAFYVYKPLDIRFPSNGQYEDLRDSLNSV